MKPGGDGSIAALFLPAWLRQAARLSHAPSQAALPPMAPSS